MRIGIAGITGRMGRLLAEEVTAAGAELAGGTSRDGSGGFTEVAALAGASDVVIDFTNAALAQGHAKVLADLGKPWVLGTSGLSDADEAAVADMVLGAVEDEVAADADASTSSSSSLVQAAVDSNNNAITAEVADAASSPDRPAPDER